MPATPDLVGTDNKSTTSLLAKPQPIPALTSLRFIAAIGVVFYHTWGVFLPGQSHNWFYEVFVVFGYTGVSFFYVLSGFILGYNHLHGNTPSVNKKKFWAARFARVYPMYIVALIVVVPIVIATDFAYKAPAIAIRNLGSSLIANVLLVQAWYWPLKHNLNPPGWSVSAEAFFYAMFPAIGVWIWKRGTSYRRLIGLALGCWFLALIVPLIGAFQWHLDQAPDSIGENPLLRLPEFCLGIITAKIVSQVREQWTSHQIRQIAGFCIVISLACLIAVALTMQGKQWQLLLNNGLVAPAFAAIIFALSFPSPSASLLSERPLVVLGEASYSIYLLHFPLMWWIVGLHTPHLMLKDFMTGGRVENNIVEYIIYLSIVIALSMISFVYIETPARKWLLKRLSVRFNSPLDATTTAITYVFTDTTNDKEPS